MSQSVRCVHRILRRRAAKIDHLPLVYTGSDPSLCVKYTTDLERIVSSSSRGPLKVLYSPSGKIHADDRRRPPRNRCLSWLLPSPSGDGTRRERCRMPTNDIIGVRRPYSEVPVSKSIMSSPVPRLMCIAATLGALATGFDSSN